MPSDIDILSVFEERRTSMDKKDGKRRSAPFSALMFRGTAASWAMMSRQSVATIISNRSIISDLIQSHDVKVVDARGIMS
jgi:hypothetical protein